MLEGVVDGGTLFSFIIYAVFLILSILHFLLAKEQTSWKRKTIRKRNHLKQTVVSKTGKCPSLCFFWFHDCRSTYYIKQDNQNALEMWAFLHWDTNLDVTTHVAFCFTTTCVGVWFVNCAT